jgi:hypothetical protein
MLFLIFHSPLKRFNFHLSFVRVAHCFIANKNRFFSNIFDLTNKVSKLHPSKARRNHEIISNDLFPNNFSGTLMALPLPVTSFLVREMVRNEDSLILVFADQNSKISYFLNPTRILSSAFVSADAVFRKKRQPPSEFPTKP